MDEALRQEALKELCDSPSESQKEIITSFIVKSKAIDGKIGGITGDSSFQSTSQTPKSPNETEQDTTMNIAKPSTEERIAEALSEVNCEKVTECPPEVEVPLQTPTADSPEKEKNLEKTSNSEAAKESNSVEITSEPDDSLPQSDSPSLDYFVPNSQVNDSINPGDLPQAMIASAPLTQPWEALESPTFEFHKFDSTNALLEPRSDENEISLKEENGKKIVSVLDKLEKEDQVESVEKNSELEKKSGLEENVLLDNDKESEEKAQIDEVEEVIEKVPTFESESSQETAETPLNERVTNLQVSPQQVSPKESGIDIKSVPWSSPDIFTFLLDKNSLEKLKRKSDTRDDHENEPLPKRMVLRGDSEETSSQFSPLPEPKLTFLERLRKRRTTSNEVSSKKFPKTVLEMMLFDNSGSLSPQSLDSNISLLEIAIKAGLNFYPKSKM